MTLKIRDRFFNWGERTYLMGILNVTPDSFSDGGEFNSVETAFSQARDMIKNGADIIDIGGESTRPNAAEVSIEDELDRVIPVIRQLRQESAIPISIDTTKAIVAEKAIAAGADIVNDISGATFDDKMLATVAKLDVPIILMHIRGNPKTMQSLTDYQDVVTEVAEFLTIQAEKAIACGIDKSHIIVDPGIGFAKTASQSLELVQRLAELKVLHLPILVGVSRKSFMGPILKQDRAKDRVWGTSAACYGAISRGADILRVHDVTEMYDVCRVADAIERNFIR
ncbi:dihydropteroate synthase [Waterburya agarophytonicola K14]|uniref:Dihydropteroate synthase n=1 Tax=Waterburya agarophytonicola KI4 TaxID=2874699 RepID=A0A964BTI4_9CYAN|nr:dihydropteroate synthase [Waterburya agarophytonicola]MCC0179205.1 dihydropteroate synthase [Waterburya agarophytonicola KI4]